MEDGRGKREETTILPTWFSCTGFRWKREDGRWKKKTKQKHIILPLVIGAKSGGFLRHGMEHGEDLLILIIQIFINLGINISTGEGEFEPGLGFGGFLPRIGQLIDKDSFVSSLAPGLGKVGANRPGRSTDLIGQ
jgi:hypothetical protein